MSPTLHNTTIFMKRFGIGAIFGIGIIITLVIVFNIGVLIYHVIFPPKIQPANQAYGPLPALEFPETKVKSEFTYAIDTLDGDLPILPDRLVVYPIINDTPNLLNLDDVKEKVTKLGFVDLTGKTVKEIPRGGSLYEWQEPKDLQRKITYDIVNLDFTLTSNYLESLNVLRATSLGTQEGAVNTVKEELQNIKSLPEDIDLDSTLKPASELTYLTKPRLYSITNGQLTETTSLSRAQIIRADLYQKNMKYKLTAGTNAQLTRFQNFDMDLPIMYPNPPYSTMNFLVGSGLGQADIVEANFNYQKINREPETQATYPLKTAKEAFDELKNGKGFVATYYGNESQILIKQVYLAYYLGTTLQKYLMPIIVFEGPDGFFAYVSAVRQEALQ